MVTRNYQLEKPERPSAAKRFLDQDVIPAVVDVLGAGEEALLACGRRVKRAPRQALLFAFIAGALASVILAFRA